MTSKKAREIWLPFLMEDITINFCHLPGLLNFLISNFKVTRSIKSFKQRGFPDKVDQKAKLDYLLAFRNVKPEGSESQEMAEDKWIQKFTTMIFGMAKNLETISLTQGKLYMPLVNAGDLKGLDCILHSLKRIRIESTQKINLGLFSGKKAVWILQNCQSLQTAVFNFALSDVDADYLKSNKKSFKGLSKVKHLALGIAFIAETPTRFAWSSPKVKGALNKKSQAVHDLLLVTNQLLSLELFAEHDLSSRELVNPDVIGGLSSSFSTLKHLRLMHVAPDQDAKIITCFAPFTSLNILGFHWDTLACCAQAKKCTFPKSLETIQLVYYVQDGSPVDPYAFQEELILAMLLTENPGARNLKQVIVPSAPINYAYQENKFPNQLKVWKANRELLKDGIEVHPKLKQLKLKVLQPREIGEFTK